MSEIENPDHIISCPKCGSEFNGFDEEVFTDSLCDDSGHTEINCPSCESELPITTHCTYRFGIDKEEMDSWPQQLQASANQQIKEGYE